MTDPKPEHIKLVTPEAEATTIAKPPPFSLDAFVSQTDASTAGVETLLTALPHHPLPQAGDFARLHPDEANYWSRVLCFVTVPIKGQTRDNLHLIVEPLAKQFLPPKKVQRFRLALGTKPHNVFFLCHIPLPLADNTWVSSNLQACELAKHQWVQATSRKSEGVESYKVDFARDPDAFPTPKWPAQTLDELVTVTFTGRMITQANDPPLLRLIGAKPSVT